MPKITIRKSLISFPKISNTKTSKKENKTNPDDNYEWFDSTYVGQLNEKKTIMVIKEKDKFGSDIITHQYRHFAASSPFSCQVINKLATVDEYFDNKMIEKIIIPLLCQSYTVSLRTLEWLVTNYTKSRNIALFIHSETNPTQVLTIVNIYTSYNLWLKKHGRKYFDPFRRGKRIYMEYNNKWYETTVGQMLFLYWIISKRILAYVEEHSEEIKQDMNECMSKIRANGKIRSKMGLRKKREELSTCNIPACMIYEANMNTTIFL